jgi:GWxTD domain-containing protein
MLSYQKEENRLKSAFKIYLILETPDSQQITYKFDKISYIPSYEEAEKRKLYGIEKIDLFLKPGKYHSKLVFAFDSLSEEVERVIEIDSLRDNLWISDIKFATSIEPTQDSGKFIKNGLKIIPNPQAIFGEKYFNVYTYIEIYNLNIGKNYALSYNIFNEKEELVYFTSPETLLANSKDVMEVRKVDIRAFKEGKYIFECIVNQENETAKRRKEFYIIKEIEKKDFTAEELKYYHLIKYIASPKALKFYNSLPQEAKHRYLVNFWQRVGKSALHTLIKRVKYADTNFSVFGKLGRESDMGRIWIKYGKPDEIEKLSFHGIYRPCERWSYFEDGGKVFIFVDKKGTGEYELMYSSIQEEPTAPDYRKWINPEILHLGTLE